MTPVPSPDAVAATTEAATPAAPASRHGPYSANLARRRRGDRWFAALGLGAVMMSLAILAVLLVAMLANSLAGFTRAEVRLDHVSLALAGITPADLAAPDALDRLERAGLPARIDAAAAAQLGPDGPALLGEGAWRTAAASLIADPVHAGTHAFTLSLPVADSVAAALRGEGTPHQNLRAATLARARRLSWVFDTGFFTRSDATEAQVVGIRGALTGTLFTLAICLVLAFPIGVLAALYLEEFAPRGRWTDLIEVSINNLAAVPSIIFGLLGLAVFLTLAPEWRSSSLVGGMTLALMTMPVIVIAGRNAIAAVPPSVREAALGIGASKLQVVFDHVLPLALPGMMTGTIIGMARALGETAPLLMIGMRAFVASPPSDSLAPATVLPVQIFLWSDEVDRGFIARTSAAIVVLLAVLLAMNGLAIWLRYRFARRL